MLVCWCGGTGVLVLLWWCWCAGVLVLHNHVARLPFHNPGGIVPVFDFRLLNAMQGGEVARRQSKPFANSQRGRKKAKRDARGADELRADGLAKLKDVVDTHGNGPRQQQYGGKEAELALADLENVDAALDATIEAQLAGAENQEEMKSHPVEASSPAVVVAAEAIGSGAEISRVATAPPLRQNPPGCPAVDLNSWSGSGSGSDGNSDTGLSVPQRIQDQIREDHTNTDAIVALPVGCDALVWQYEHMRQTCLELNGLVVAMTETCTATTCPGMTTGPGLSYLNTAHHPPRPTSAMTYMLNILDQATGQLCSGKLYPSRDQIPASSAKHFKAVSRRVYRIFAHAYFSHRAVFDAFETNTSLLRRFHGLSRTFGLMTESDLIVPM